MSRTQRTAAVASLVLGMLVVGNADAAAQAPYSPGVGRQSHIATGLDNPALRYFGGGQNLAATHRAPSPAQPAAPQPLPQPTSKPFQGVTPTSTVTPYLALGVAGGADALSNYYNIVRPQIQQRQQLEMQQAQLVKLQQQLRAGGAVVPRGGMPTTGSNVGRFQNYGGYYLTR